MDCFLERSKSGLGSLMNGTLGIFRSRPPAQDTINGILLDSRTGVQYPKGTVTRDWGLLPAL